MVFGMGLPQKLEFLSLTLVLANQFINDAIIFHCAEKVTKINLDLNRSGRGKNIVRNHQTSLIYKLD